MMQLFRFGFGALAVLAMVLAALPASALDACFAQSVGPWSGPVWNGGGLQHMDTTFRLGSDGTLVGTYHVYDTLPFDGSLTDFHQTGRCEADLTWYDRYGTGTVHIQFEPNVGRFLGLWGDKTPFPGLLFNGYRRAPSLTS